MVIEQTQFCTSFGEVTLSRHSRSNSRKEQNLRPWDAADELLLAHLAEQKPAPGARFLIVNDQYGALTVALTASSTASGANDHIHFVSDSFLSRRAATENLLMNDLSDKQISWYDSLDNIEGEVDVVLIKLPKSLSLLEDQLHRYRSVCTPTTRVVAAGMVKHMSAGVFKLMERILGVTQTSLAKKKARLIFCKPESGDKAVSSLKLASYHLEGTDFQIDNYANVFSRESLDFGTRLLLENLPKFGEEAQANIADLGCGNGVIGIIAAKSGPRANVDFYDESYMALASAEVNFKRAFPEKTARFIADDGMSSADAEYYDVILCNPPFHQHHVIGDFVAQQMFRDAKRALKTGGEFRVVANRHLAHFDNLKRLFGNCQWVAKNHKFVVIKAIKR